MTATACTLFHLMIVCKCSASLCLFTITDQLHQPIGSAGSPPVSVFSCFSHCFTWQIKYDDDVFVYLLHFM